MAQLSSPGVSVTVIDESFYAPAAPGTVPLIFVATEENKQNSAGTGIAPGTLAANAGQVYLMTSQRDLSDTFGTPVFKTDVNNNPIHAGEQNEYGLQTAYSYLGVSNRAYVVRANIDLGQLDATPIPPAGSPSDGDWWFDIATTEFGIFEWNSASVLAGGQKFAVKNPIVITELAKLEENPYRPIASFGAVGSYAIVAYTNLITLWYKKPKTSEPVQWVEVGSEGWIASRPAAKGTTTVLDNTAIDGITFSIKVGDVTTPVSGSTVSGLIANINFNGLSAALINGKVEIYSTGTSFELVEDAWNTKFGIAKGVYNSLALAIDKHTKVPEWKVTNDTPRPTGSVWIKTSRPNLGANWSVKVYNSATGSWVTKSAPLYKNNKEALRELDSTGGGINLTKDTVYVKYNDDEQDPPYANFKIYVRKATGSTSIASAPLITEGIYKFTISETVPGSVNFEPTSAVTSVIEFGTDPGANAELLADAINALEYQNIVATIDANNRVTVTHVLGGDIKIVDDSTGQEKPFVTLFPVGYDNNLYEIADKVYLSSLWTAEKNGQGFIVANDNPPATITNDGRLWYSSTIDEVDILINVGDKWVGYQYAGDIDGTSKSPYYNADPTKRTDPNGPIVMASKPTSQSDGTPLVHGDIWISTDNIENYPEIYVYDTNFSRWNLIDKTDQTTEDGIIFADVRWTASGIYDATNNPTNDPSTISELLASDYVDFDAPDPVLYPKGMLLWNLRRSGFNVKKYVQNYIDINVVNLRYGDEPQTEYYPHRWVTISANQEDGSGSFGRLAQRKVVVQALQALVNSNQDIRDEEGRVFNLIACPGYPELVGEMVSLNYDRQLTAFVIGDSPARLRPDATSLSNWGNNVNQSLEDGDKGLNSFDEYLAFFYPWGYTSDNLGNNVVVPPSHMILRMIALSDNVSYPWFAPAGTRRGMITNATSVGYVDSEGEFRSVFLNTGQRDTLASIKVNPITFISNSGLVNFAQYTRARNASALDRINVARLIVYLRRQLTLLARPYIFEPNDKITRDEFKGAIDGVMLGLVGQRALYDFIVVCDQSNNTPARIDRYELWADVAIEPVKAAEFIYIPLRLKNTGEISGGMSA